MATQNNFVKCGIYFGVLINLLLLPAPVDVRSESYRSGYLRRQRLQRSTQPSRFEPQIFFGDEDESSTPVQFSTRENYPNITEDGSLRPSKFYFDETTRRFYAAGSTGPCPYSMVFDLMADSTEEVKGQCHCQQNGNKKKQMTLVQDAKSGKCFPLFTQGPCSADEWLALNEDSEQFQCEMNPCILIATTDVRNIKENQFVLFNKRCVRLGSTAPECSVDQTVLFLPGISLPQCASADDVADYAFGSLGRGSCKRGTSRSPSGKCVKNFIW